MVVKARTVYTKELLVKFNRFNFVKSSMAMGIFIFIELVVFTYAAYTFIDAFVWGYLEYVVFELVLSLILLLLLPSIIFVFPASLKLPFEVVNNFEVTDSEIIVDSISQKATSQTRVMTAQLEAVYDTRDTFYLYISKREAFIIRKADILEGSVSDLQNILRRNLPAKKYIVKNF